MTKVDGATHVLAAVIHLESPCTKGVVQSEVFIHKQREIEFLLLNNRWWDFPESFETPKTT